MAMLARSAKVFTQRIVTPSRARWAQTRVATSKALKYLNVSAGTGIDRLATSGLHEEP
jgi:hypothetical protein